MELRAFGAPGNCIDGAAAEALERAPGIQVAFLPRERDGRPRVRVGNKKVLLLSADSACSSPEKPTGSLPDPRAYVERCVEGRPRGEPGLLVVQMHPGWYDRASVANFKELVLAVRRAGYVACTASEYFGLA